MNNMEKMEMLRIFKSNSTTANNTALGIVEENNDGVLNTDSITNGNIFLAIYKEDKVLLLGKYNNKIYNVTTGDEVCQ